MEEKWIDYDETNQSLWVRFMLKEWWYDDYDIIENFEENEEEYKFENDMWMTYTVYKNSIKWEPKFYELSITCRHCDKLHPYSERIIWRWKHYRDTEREFKRDWDFCSEVCLNNYLEENQDFTLDD